MAETTPPLKVYTTEEIELLLVDSDRAVDRLLMHSLNGLAAVLIPHAEGEEKVLGQLEQIGGMRAITKRAQWIDTQIAREQKKLERMDKIITSVAIWAVILFLAYAGVSLYEHIVEGIRAQLVKVK